MHRGRTLLAAALLLLAASALMTGAAWVYHGRLGEIHGRIVAAGVVSAFSIDAGNLYSGSSKTVNGTATLVVPEESQVTFYAECNASVAYSIDIYADGVLLGTITPEQNVTATLSAGEHSVEVRATITAPPVNTTTAFSIEVWVEAG